MSPIKVDVVTAERTVFSDEVDVVVAPGVQGQLGILPHHAPLMTTLKPGALRLRKGGEETVLAISGGFMEVRPDKIIILADAAERAEEIDVARAEAARQRARERLAHHTADLDEASAEAALMRALVRLQVAEKVGRRKKPATPAR